MDAIFYIANLDLRLTECALPKEEAKHIIRVLRMHENDTLLLTDGNGHFVQSHISKIEGKNCWVAFDKIEKQAEPAYRLHLAVAPTKNNNRYEWMLEKATEIGIATITPIISAHSERKTVNRDRLEKIIISAAKQSQKAYFPILSEPMSFSDFIKKDLAEKKFIAHCNSNLSRTNILEEYQKGKDAIILIGPEGDFSPEEVRHAEDNGYLGIHLGTSRLRTETAGIVACSSIYQINF